MTDTQQNATVLLIEDHRDIAEMVLEFLEQRGFTVDYAADGVTGLHLAVTTGLAVVLLAPVVPVPGGDTPELTTTSAPIRRER